MKSLVLSAALCFFLSGCAAIAVGSMAVGAVSTGVSLAVDAGVGAVKLTGKAVGAAVDVVTPGSEPAK